jgi:hypothetical protein
MIRLFSSFLDTIYLRFEVCGFGFECIPMWNLDIFAGYYSCISVAAFYSSIPHSIVIGKLSESFQTLRLLLFLLFFDWLAILLLGFDHLRSGGEGIL